MQSGDNIFVGYNFFYIHYYNKCHFLALRQSDKVVEEVFDEMWSGSAMKISHSQVLQPTPRRHLKSGGQPVYRGKVMFQGANKLQ